MIFSLIFLLVGLSFPPINDSSILRETFDYPNGSLPPSFWSEGCAGVIRNGWLFINADTVGERASTVWLDRELSGNLSVEFDARIRSSSDDANNVNIMFMYADSTGKPLRASASERRDGLYSRYHKLNGYIFTNVTNHEPNIRYRFRRNPGFVLMSETFMPRKRTDKSVHIKIVKTGNRFQYWENDTKILDTVDDKSGHSYDK